jgi:hypothetical protein
MSERGGEEAGKQGKIARLPLEVRHELNIRLRDGNLAPEILPWLNGLATVRAVVQKHCAGAEVNPSNLSNWRLSGYRDWLARQEQLEEKRELAQFCFELAESGKNLLDGSASILGAKLMEVIEDIDVEAQRALLAEKPDTLVGLIRGLTQLQSKANEDYKLKQTDRRIDLEERKFEGRFLKLFEQYYQDRAVREIMAGKDGAQVKMEQLRTHIFGARPFQEAQP